MPLRRPVAAAFADGSTPTIALINKASLDLGVPLRKLLSVLQVYAREFAGVWGTPCKLITAADFVPGAWALVFLDDADAAGALGYHDLTPDGLPLAKVFVRTTVDDGEKVSVTASHELAEMLLDPGCQLAAQGPGGRFYALEACDAVEEETFEIAGVPVSDYVLPSFFESFRAAGSMRFDRCGKVRRPFETLPGGYQLVAAAGRWSNVFGSKKKEARFGQEDRRGHRSEHRRGHAGGGTPKASRPARG